MAGCIDYIGKCATCAYFRRNKNPDIRDGRCLKRRRSRGGVIGYSAGCKVWALKPDTICPKCNTFIENWYNFCPICSTSVNK